MAQWLKGITDAGGMTFKVVGDGAGAAGTYVAKPFASGTGWVMRNVGLESLAPPAENEGTPEQQAARAGRDLTDDEIFEQADDLYSDWKPAQPLNKAQQLYVYALRRQAIWGDVEGKKPPITKPDARAKWMAWAQLEGDYTKSEAKARFVAETQRLMKSHGSRKK